MTLSLRAKLFLTLLCVSLLTIVVSHAFVRWTFMHGLQRLVAERQDERLDIISARLRRLHQIDGDWQQLAENRILWLQALAGPPSYPTPEKGWHGPRHAQEHREQIRSPDRHLHGGYRPPPPWLREALRREPREPNSWPPRQALAHMQAGERPRTLALRLMLLDADGDIVYGRPTLLADAERRPLLDGGTRIGTLAVLPGPSIMERPEMRFRERQSSALWLIVIGVALLGALLAFPLSKRLTRPVREFQHTARRLAAGDYDARAEVTGRDELGRLGRDLNALAETLGQTEQARRQWVADISHELRTPLSLLRADTEAMQDGVRPLDQAALEHMHADLLRLGRLVDDLYELSMTDLGALSYRKAPVDVAEMLRDELASFGRAFEEAGLRIRLQTDGAADLSDLPGKHWQINGDAQRLSQLFRNLLRNTLAYTDRGGELRITLSRPGSPLSITFEDSAPGVPEADLGRLFERLYRVDASRSRVTGGAGLGLAIARNIVQAHGGRISAAPSSLGGLRVVVELCGNDSIGPHQEKQP